MIDFSKYNEESFYRPDDKVEYKKIVKDISACVQKSALDKYVLGRKLIEFFESRRYGGYENKELQKLYSSVKVWTNNLHQDRFFAVCEYEFGLEKSVVSRLMNVVDEFGDGEKGLKVEFSKYKYSVLVEMLSLSPEQRENIKSDWTVSKVREYKKSLVATSQQNEDEKTEEKPKEEFPQFKSWKRNDFIRRILTLEKENATLREKLFSEGKDKIIERDSSL